ncbi:MAG: hypothetical protein KatS3mg024_2205 [Armatimonadota bacterium]|nr:MAG: hypothetical protein KatS3mg024_2205 [Armatimonadota bacterium]
MGLYYSLNDWHHPDGRECLYDEGARKRFVEYTHGLVRELCSNYGKIDILWYDCPYPLSAEGWESERLNAMVRSLQPDILINNRSRIPEDFETPEQHITPAKGGRAWESCMTLNDSWGYTPIDRNYKTAWHVVRMLRQVASHGGNLLLNIGPAPDGSIPPVYREVFGQVGRWLQKNGPAIYDASDPMVQDWQATGDFTRKGNTAYFHCNRWPGSSLVIGGLETRVISVRYLGGPTVEFEQTRRTTHPERPSDGSAGPSGHRLRDPVRRRATPAALAADEGSGRRSGIVVQTLSCKWQGGKEDEVMRAAAIILASLTAGGALCAAAQAQPGALQVLAAQYRADIAHPESDALWASVSSGAIDPVLHPERTFARPALGGNIHVYLRNASRSAVEVEDVLLEGISLKRAVAFSDQRKFKRHVYAASIYFSDLPQQQRDRLVALGEPIWWRVDPARAEPGDAVEVTVRLRRDLAAQGARRDPETEAGGRGSGSSASRERTSGTVSPTSRSR